MKKIFYLLFLIILCFSFNIKINAEEGYCEYSLIRFEENGFYNFSDNEEKEITFKISIDTDNPNKANLSWKSGGYTVITEESNKFGIQGPDGYPYKFIFSSNISYNDLINDNIFECPKLYGGQNLNDLSLEIFTMPNGRDDLTSVTLKLVGQKKPQTAVENELIGECGVGIMESGSPLPDNFGISFKKYKNKNDVCIEYFLNPIKCKEFLPGDELVIDTNPDGVPRRFSFIPGDLEKIFDNINEQSNSCPNMWIDPTQAFEGIYKLSLEKPNGISDSTMTEEDYNNIQAEKEFMNGDRYKYLLGSLKMPLSMLYGLPLDFTLQVGANKNYNFENIEANNDLCPNNNSDCINNANYLSEQGLKNIRSYCNNVYEKYGENYDMNLNERMDECISFNKFYTQLVNEGIVNNLADYCGILSEDFVEKLSFFLNIIMIAGPILAILLGSVDFIKVIANGDADKEMKTAFKHFMIRVGSAALLFIIPLLLSFILNIFMANEGGYDPENPFCNVNDWSEQ